MAVPIAFANNETPPEDDVCPVCFSEFVLPCRVNCGHWFCGSCILKVWKVGSVFHACKCPTCRSYIKTLKAGTFLQLQDEEEARKVLKSIERYNGLFKGGAQRFFLTLCDLLLLLGRMFFQITDPHHIDRLVILWQVPLAYVCKCIPSKLIPNGWNGKTLFRHCNLIMHVIAFVIKITWAIKRDRAAGRVRRQAALENPAGE